MKLNFFIKIYNKSFHVRKLNSDQACIRLDPIKIYRIILNQQVDIINWK